MKNTSFKEVNNNDSKAWKLERISKGIKLSGALEKYVGVSKSMISMHENDKAQLAPERVERYKSFISSYPDEPKLIADSK